MWERGQNTAISTFDATGQITKQISGRGERFITSDTATSGGFFGGYSIVGMSAKKIPAVVASIKSDYVKKIVNHIDQIETLASADQAFKSEEVQAAVKAYLEKVKEYCMNLCSVLNAFADKAEDAHKAWTEFEKNTAASLGASTSATNAGDLYTGS